MPLGEIETTPLGCSLFKGAPIFLALLHPFGVNS